MELGPSTWNVYKHAIKRNKIASLGAILHQSGLKTIMDEQMMWPSCKIIILWLHHLHHETSDEYHYSGRSCISACLLIYMVYTNLVLKIPNASKQIKIKGLKHKTSALWIYVYWYFPLFNRNCPTEYPHGEVVVKLFGRL